MDASATLRRFPREPVTDPVHVEGDNFPKRLAILCDVSRAGATIVCNTRMEIDERVQLTVYLDLDSRDELVLEGYVAHLDRRGGEVTWRYAAGICFDRILSQEEFLSVVHHERCYAHDDVTVPIDLELGDSTHAVAVAHDLSASGAMMLCRHRLEVGEHVRVNLQCGEESFPGARQLAGLVVPASVARLSRVEDGGLWRWAVAVRFDAPLLLGRGEPGHRRAA
jgi:hypothetical protein